MEKYNEEANKAMGSNHTNTVTPKLGKNKNISKEKKDSKKGRRISDCTDRITKNSNEFERKYSVNFNEHVKKKDFIICINHLEYEQKSKIDELIIGHKSLFAKDKYDIGTVTDYEAHIDLLIDKYCSKRD